MDRDLEEDYCLSVILLLFGFLHVTLLDLLGVEDGGVVMLLYFAVPTKIGICNI